jgi:hypothetical protein
MISFGITKTLLQIISGSSKLYKLYLPPPMGPRIRETGPLLHLRRDQKALRMQAREEEPPQHPRQREGLLLSLNLFKESQPLLENLRLRGGHL